ncbi:hypothetical protein NLJ89_g6984 [Agrocybe chaxingu]|uniref:DNA-directed RNA polymerase III subunit RPC6 n=1 Tax=Agrocybe chaxingu TaxID=84603 RepID=A0A9W8K4G4_9AGAR|nr:hypothetical protein NLJ89_g6984 [Agrocybe chaxingu]
MSKRPPNELESRLHQAALASSKKVSLTLALTAYPIHLFHPKELTAKQAESIVPDATTRQNALNFLLAVGLFKGLKSSSGHVSFRAVSKEEITATKGLTGEENLVLGHIKSSGNEGIWTKHLKAKTSLHQTVIDRCLKTLTQKRLIKRVQSVQHITRKIYMLEGLEPSIALTGGPWYTDNELDTEFIQNLTDACYKLISDISFPKRRNSAEGVLYPISHAPQYPTAENIRESLRKARLTETELTAEHVEMLLNVLILDGKIEKIPAFGSALWNSDAIGDGDESEDGKSSQKKKRKKRTDDDSDQDDSRTKRKKKKHTTSDEETNSDEEPSRRKRKRSKVKVEPDSETHSEAEAKKKKKKKQVSSDLESSSEEERSRKKSKKKKKKAVSSESDSSSESETERRPKKKSWTKSTKRSPSPNAFFDFGTGSGGGSVYRALKEVNSAFGWTESPVFSERYCTVYLEPTGLLGFEDHLRLSNTSQVFSNYSFVKIFPIHKGEHLESPSLRFGPVDSHNPIRHVKLYPFEIKP